MSATVNPDFGQVEQDPAVLNLSVFETFYPEKRPFFLEDSRTFVPPYGNFQLFHSRRIGRTPGRLLTLDSGEQVVEQPNETTILGAAKLTGKSSQWTYGALTAVTGREYADIDTPVVDGTGFTRQERLIEPATSYNVLRLQRDIGSSNIGALVTGVLREKARGCIYRWLRLQPALGRQPHAVGRPLGDHARAGTWRHQDERRRRHQLQLHAQAFQHRRSLRSFRPRLPRQRHRLPPRATESQSGQWLRGGRSTRSLEETSAVLGLR